MTFDTKTGVITCNPPAGLPAASYSFTVTATNAGGKVSFNVPLQLLGSGDPVWQVINGVTGGNTYAGVNSMKYDSNCNCLYIAGTTTGNLDGQTIPTTGGARSGFLSKYDLNGNKLWTKVFGVSGSSSINTNGITVDSSGNIYITGGVESGNFNGLTISVGASPNVAGYIIKYDPAGNVVWTASSAPNVRHYYSGIVIDINSDIVVAGAVYASSIDGMTNTGWADQAVIAQKFDKTTGARINGAIVGGSSSLGTDGYGVGSDSSGNIYVAGASRAPSPNCGIGSTAYWRPVLFRFNSSMSYIGCTFITVSSTAFAFGATASPNGESYISGYGSGTIDSIGPIGTTDGYFTKFDNLGNKLWTKRLGVPGAITTINSVVYEPNVNMIYITGLTNGNLAGTVTGTRDMFVAKYDPSGNQIWIKMQGINNDSIGLGVGDGTSIVFDQSKTMYSFGHTNVTVNGITNPAAPNNALFLVRNVQ